MNEEYNEIAQPHVYSEIIRDAVFVGDVPFETIKEYITTQFEDYINMEDTTDYVDVFYSQWLDSMNNVSTDDQNQDDMFNVLEDIKNEFVSFMEDLFQKRLSISISVIDNEDTEEDEIEIALRRLYEFFILNGRTYLKYVITTTVAKNLKYVIEDDSQFFDTVKDMLTQFSPFIIAINPTEYIDTVCKMYDAQDVKDLFESGQITGNFLRKYSPKLYKNEELEVEIIADITMWSEWQREEHTEEENIQFESFLLE